MREFRYVYVDCTLHVSPGHKGGRDTGLPRSTAASMEKKARHHVPVDFETSTPVATLAVLPEERDNCMIARAVIPKVWRAPDRTAPSLSARAHTNQKGTALLFPNGEVWRSTAQVLEGHRFAARKIEAGAAR
jgi:hypothetical protein